jgi:hypothetical protein
METAPLLGDAGLLAVAPVATFIELHGPTLVRLMPHDGVGARAIAAWLAGGGVSELLVVHDHDRDYGVAVGGMCAAAARNRGSLCARAPFGTTTSPSRRICAVPRRCSTSASRARAPSGCGTTSMPPTPRWLLGSEGVAEPSLARELSASAAERTQFFLAQRAPFGFYGYQAMTLILDAIAAGDGDRAATARAGRATRERDSILGAYSLDEQGHTTCTAYGRLAVRDGELIWDRDRGDAS